MKLVISLLLALSSFYSIAQTEDFIVDFAEVDPQFPGGEDAMKNFINQNIEYPLKAQAEGEQGIVYVQFVVQKDGQIKDVKILRGVSENLDKAAAQVVKKMPKWTPGTQSGKKVSVRYTLPIHFKLNPGDQRKAKKKLRGNEKPESNPHVIDY
ncbi:energy transducer TonB [Paracrocinitomix mangrovi]|uniref:energy transducer TonB n=1 Tax=Paracrocinitomix mangrovi TaxID=2862509 RepID=UPI001C8E3BD0|nr:energy transducer TonB [Paracrocinitomix mangrovi]UKN02155.1 energy transducer TonB [Paracrocinitomix mangrovi]